MRLSRDASSGNARISANCCFSQTRLFKGRVNVVEICPAFHADGFVKRHAQLHLDTFEKRFGQFEHASAPFHGNTIRLGAIQDPLRLRQPRQQAGVPGVAEAAHRCFFQLGLVNQPAARVGIVVSPVERLLKSPVFQDLRRSRFFHRLKLLERRKDLFIGEQCAAPVSFQSEQPLGKVLGVTVANEIAAVVPQHVR